MIRRKALLFLTRLSWRRYETVPHAIDPRPPSALQDQGKWLRRRVVGPHPARPARTKKLQPRALSRTRPGFGRVEQVPPLSGQPLVRRSRDRDSKRMAAIRRPHRPCRGPEQAGSLGRQRAVAPLRLPALPCSYCNRRAPVASSARVSGGLVHRLPVPPLEAPRSSAPPRSARVRASLQARTLWGSSHFGVWGVVLAWGRGLPDD